MMAIEQAVRAALGKLTIAFEHELSDLDGTVAVFTEALRDLAPLDVEGAVTRVIRTERFFPRPSVLRGHALEEQTARAVWTPVSPESGDGCPLCGADGYWLRGVQQPEPDEKHWPKRVIEEGRAAPKFFERIEIMHTMGCRIRHREQPYNFEAVA